MINLKLPKTKITLSGFAILFLTSTLFFYGCKIDYSEIRRSLLKNINSYANTYHEHNENDLEKLKRFDIVVIDPYDVPDKNFVKQLKENKVIVIAYIDIGEAEESRIYWDKLDKSLIITANPDWEGCYYVDVNNPKWHNIIIDTAIPYILNSADYDGLCLDMLDVVDIYPNLKKGMVNLIKGIREKFPQLILVPNRGFGILKQIYLYIDAFKYEEMSSRYDFEIKEYVYEEDQNEMGILLDMLKLRRMPVLVLDHVQTNPPDEKMAKTCFDRCEKVSQESGFKFIWYGNAVGQDFPVWSFLKLK